jgi:CRP-like cAMP-binding protein
LPTTDIALMRRNRLLSTVHELELSRFTDMLTLREFKTGEVLSEPGQRIAEVVFPVDGVFSVVAETSDGDQVEAGTIGNEGVVGLAPFLGAESSSLRTMCQIPGSGLVAEVGLLLARADGALATAARRYALSFMTMASQGAACNRLHTIEQRAARWLLMVNDRLDRNPFELTQEFFAIMLGTTRPSVTLAAAALRAAGLISYERGRITIVNRAGLEAAACECYLILTEEYERATGARLRADGDARPARAKH